MNISIVAAMGKNGVIGRDGSLPWPRDKAKSDLAWFRRLTLGHPVIMGRKTFESIGKVLDGRFNFILSKTLEPRNFFENSTPVSIVKSVPDLMEMLHSWDFWPELRTYHDEVFVIGGEQIYREFLDIADRMYLKVFEREFDGDVVFPRFTHPGFFSQWEVEAANVEEPEGEYERILTVWDRSLSC